ncbi:diguanylate cyclase [Roseibium sp.]|uniref:sensor domain-containing diguanylate cyclase n=1 Tax=Roseibium sp. TaxID=1936156 RepID=UPI003B521473
MPILRTRVVEVALVAVVYILTARLGQTLAIPPGNVTPVWIPSGLMLAWALVRGPGIWPGVFLGAYLGNVWAYFDPGSALSMMQSLLAGIPNGIGDALASVGAAALLHKHFRPFRLFQSVSAASAFLAIGVAGGSAASALFGASGLVFAGIIPVASYGYVFATWFTGDALGVLTIAPLAIAILRKEKFKGGGFPTFEAIANFALVSIAGFAAFWGGIAGLVLSFELVATVTLLLWAALRLSGLYVSIVIFYLAAGIIVPTALGYGPLREVELNTALINAQLMIGVIGVLLLMLHASREQVRLHVQRLEEARDTLDVKVRERTAELECAKREAERLASTDTLTGAPNRRVFLQRGNEELNRATRNDDDACIIMFDLDLFKSVNDTYGHSIGDQVLRDCAQVTMKHLRNYDLFGRIGGEEFALLLPETIEADAFEVAEKLRLAFKERCVSRHNLHYSASFGISPILMTDRTLSTALRRADLALYQAKTNGRNCSVVYDPSMGQAPNTLEEQKKQKQIETGVSQ